MSGRQMRQEGATMSDLKWRRLNLSRSDGHPPAGQMRIVRLMVTPVSKPMYAVVCFKPNPRDPVGRKLWRFSGYAGNNDPANWARQNADAQWAAFNTRREVSWMGDWVLYAAAIVGAWTTASATITLAEALGKKKDRFSAGTEKRSRQTESVE